MVCGRPSSSSTKLSLVRSLTICPCLLRTVARTLTTLTSVLKVVSWPRRRRGGNAESRKVLRGRVTCGTVSKEMRNRRLSLHPPIRIAPFGHSATLQFSFGYGNLLPGLADGQLRVGLGFISGRGDQPRLEV